MNIYIIDATGEGGQRRGRLAETVKDCADRVVQSKPGTPEGVTESLILSHESEFLPIQAELCECARQGAIVVIYTGGVSERRHEAVGSGWLYWCTLVELEDVLRQLGTGCTIDNVRALLDHPERRKLLVALAILSFCASADILEFGAIQRQKLWQTDASKWVQVFKGYERADLNRVISLASAARGKAVNKGFPQTSMLISWIFAATMDVSSDDSAGSRSAGCPDDRTTADSVVPNFGAVYRELSDFLGE